MSLLNCLLSWSSPLPFAVEFSTFRLLTLYSTGYDFPATQHAAPCFAFIFEPLDPKRVLMSFFDQMELFVTHYSVILEEKDVKKTELKNIDQ